MNLFGPELLFVGKFLITDSVIGLLETIAC